METNKQEKRLNIRIDDELKKEFMALCKKKAINSSELVRQLIKEWTDKNK